MLEIEWVIFIYMLLNDTFNLIYGIKREKETKRQRQSSYEKTQGLLSKGNNDEIENVFKGQFFGTLTFFLHDTFAFYF